MAITEKMGVITQIDENGNETILYPKTKAKLVEGLIETIKETVQGIGGGSIGSISLVDDGNGNFSIVTTGGGTVNLVDDGEGDFKLEVK
jgi:hypothetical protein